MPPVAADLRTIPLFKGFADAELSELANLFVAVPPGGMLFEVGDTAKHLFLLTAGVVVLERPADDVFRMHPPALIGELGALTGLARTSTARTSDDAVLWKVPAQALQAWLGENQETGVRFLVNLLEIVADKVQRDQRRLGDMRQNLVRTQKQLKQLRELVEEAEETPVSGPIHNALEQLISTNRRVNYRVIPPSALRAQLRVETVAWPVVDLSRSHVSVAPPTPRPVGDWLAGVLELPGVDVPVSGKVIRVDGGKIAIELDLLIEEYGAQLEGYLTRVQLLDILV